MSWKAEARKISEGKYLKFEAGDKKTVQFTVAPIPREFSAKDGSKKTSLEFVVLTEEEDKIMSVSSKRLLTLIMSENDDAEEMAPESDDDDWYLEGRTYNIKAIGSGIDRQWQMKEVPTVSTPARKEKKETFKPVAEEVNEDVARGENKEESGEETESKPKKRRRKDRTTKESDPDNLLKMISAALQMTAEPIPFKIAEAVNAASVEDVRNIMAKLGYVESEKVDSKTKMTIWMKNNSNEKQEA